MARGFAAGLAQGIGNGMQMYSQYKNLEMQEENAQREKERHGMLKEQYETQKTERDRLNKGNEEFAAFLKDRMMPKQQPQQEQQQPAEAPGSLAPAEPLISDTRAPGLSAPSPQPAQAPGTPQTPQGAAAPAQPDLPADQYIQKSFLTNGIASQHEILNKAVEIYAKHGVADKMTSYLEKMYEAQKSGFADALPHLMGKNGAGAAEALRRAGIPVEGDLTLVDPETMTWKGMVGGKEQTINTRDVFGMANPVKHYELMHEQAKQKKDQELKESELTIKREEAAAGTRLKNVQADYYEGAKSDLTRAQADKADRYEPGGSGGGRAAADRPEKIDQAVNFRNKALDALSSVKGEDGKYFVHPKRRLAWDTVSAHYHDLLEDGLKRELTAKEHYKFTDRLRTYPINGTPQEKEAWQADFLRGFNADIPKKPGGQTVKKDALGNPASGKVAPGSLAKEPTEDEKQLERVKSNAMDHARLKRLQMERKAVNLTAEEEKILDDEIQSIFARHPQAKTEK